MKFVYPLDLVPYQDQIFVPQEGNVPAHYETVINVNQPDEQVVVHTATRLEHLDPDVQVQAQEVPGFAPVAAAEPPTEEKSDG